MATLASPTPRSGSAAFFRRRQRTLRLMTLPALAVIAAVIVFPWLFTVYMSAFDWKIGTVAHFVGLDNYVGLAKNQRFLESIVHTFYFTALAVIAPVTEFRDVFGVALTNMINGADPAAELKKATAEFQPVLDKSEKA